MFNVIILYLKNVFVVFIARSKLMAGPGATSYGSACGNSPTFKNYMLTFSIAPLNRNNVKRGVEPEREERRGTRRLKARHEKREAGSRRARTDEAKRTREQRLLK